MFYIQSSNPRDFRVVVYNYGGTTLGRWAIRSAGTIDGSRYLHYIYRTPANTEGRMTLASEALTFDGQWHFYAVVVQGNLNKAVGFRDGTGINAVSNVGGASSTNSFFIGGSDIGGGFGTWPGLIDEVRLYNRALSDAEIKALYDATK
jgi:hypothetical protein